MTDVFEAPKGLRIQNRRKLDEPQIIKEYEAGDSFQILAGRYGCSVTKISYILHRNDAKIRPSARGVKGIRKLSPDRARQELVLLEAMPELLLVSELAGIFGSKPTVYRMIRAGLFPGAVKIPQRLRIPKSDVAAYLRECISAQADNAPVSGFADIP